MEALSLAAVPDAVLTEVSSLPEELEGASRVGRFIQARPGALLLRVPAVGAYLVEDGRRIQIAPEADADSATVDLFLHGAARAALLHQRGDLPLHASTVKAPGGSQAIALCGLSGAGKSTLAIEMHRRGWTVLADDTTRVSLDHDLPLAWPSNRGVKLWRDACEAFALPVESLQHVRREMQKFYYPVTTGEAPVPLGAVVELSTSSQTFCHVEGIAERMSLLTRHTFRPRQIVPLGMLPRHVQFVGTIAPLLQYAQLGGARMHSVAELGDKIEEVSRWMAP